MRPMFKAFVVMDVALVLIVVGVFAVQRSLLFPAVEEPLPASLPLGIVRLDVDDQFALYLEPTVSIGSVDGRPAAMDVVLFFHGNAEVAWWSVASFDELRAAGLGIVLAEYPGYGGNPGKSSAETMVGSGLSLYDEVVSWPEVRHIYVFGRSMGGGVATSVAAEREVSGIILASTFTSLHRLVYQKRLPAFLLRDRFDSEDIVASLDTPVLVYHGTQDRLIPLEHGRQLAAAANDGWLLVNQCGHNNCPIPSAEIISWMAHYHGRGSRSGSQLKTH